MIRRPTDKTIKAAWIGVFGLIIAAIIGKFNIDLTPCVTGGGPPNSSNFSSSTLSSNDSSQSTSSSISSSSSTYVEESKTDSSQDKSESTSKPTFPPYKSSVELLEKLPINKEAYTLSDIDFEFDNKRDGTKTLRIMVSGDVKDINKYRIVPATAFKNGLIKKQIVDVEYGMICPEFFNVIAVLYNWDGDYITISKASIYTDQDHFSHIEVTFDNLDYGMYYVDFF